ncbi:MAG: hypothetical protein KatS3mg031_2779 [Chitinophagales bacterium]|nr:MAG: hypothetical protein KatS3mg031_2779 [Chitinophagales bacterium]
MKDNFILKKEIYTLYKYYLLASDVERRGEAHKVLLDKAFSKVIEEVKKKHSIRVDEDDLRSGCPEAILDAFHISIITDNGQLDVSLIKSKLSLMKSCIKHDFCVGCIEGSLPYYNDPSLKSLKNERYLADIKNKFGNRLVFAASDFKSQIIPVMTRAYKELTGQEGFVQVVLNYAEELSLYFDLLG